MWDFIMEYIMPIFLVILVMMTIIIIGFAMFKMFNGDFFITRITIQKDNYIQNLEEKVNILTLDYENFAVEDSIKQSDGYDQ